MTCVAISLTCNAQLPMDEESLLSHSSVAAFKPVLSPQFRAVENERPEGTEIEMYRNGNAYLVYGSFLMTTRVSGYKASIVEAEDGTVWINHPFTQYETGWLKADKGVGDTLVVNLPQEVLKGSTSSFYANRFTYKGSYDENGEAVGEWVADGKNAIKFTYIDGTLNEVPDAVFIMHGDNKDLVETRAKPMLALTDNEGHWTGYGDYNIAMRKFADTPLPLPAGLEAKDYMLKYNATPDSELATTARVAIDGNDVYINIYPDCPDSWVKGQINDGKVTFKSGQYLGTYETQGVTVYLYFVAGTYTTVNDDSEEGHEYKFEICDEVSMVYDTDAGTFSTADKAIFVNCGKDRIHKIYDYANPSFEIVADRAATPVDPVIIEFIDYDPDEEYGYIEVEAPNKDVDGNFIDMDKFFFRMWVDNDVYTFSPDDYYCFDEPTMLIPFTFSDEYWDFIYYDDSKHGFTFYFGDYESIGIQAVYTGGGETRYSNVVRNKEMSSTNNIVIDKEALSTTYYDLTGRIVNNPANGIYIKSTTFSDGTTRNEKIGIR